MARTRVTPQIASRAGVVGAPFSADVANGNYAAPFTGNEIFWFANSGATANVTFTAQSADPRANKTNLVVSIPGGTTMSAPVIIGPFQFADWANNGGDLANTFSIDLSASGGTITFFCITNPIGNPASTTGG